MAVGKICCLGNVKFAFQTSQLQECNQQLTTTMAETCGKSTLKHNIWQRP